MNFRFTKANNYLLPSQLSSHFGNLFKLRMLTNYNIYTMFTLYRSHAKSSDGKTIKTVDTNVVSKILITKDLMTDASIEGYTKNITIKRIPTMIGFYTSKIVININDELSPVDIKSDKVNYYCVLNANDAEEQVRMKRDYNTYIPNTLYVSMSILKFMQIMSDNSLKQKGTDINDIIYTKISLFIQEELEKGIKIDICNKAEYKVEEFPDPYNNPTYKLDIKTELVKIGECNYKYSKNFPFVCEIVREKIHHFFDSQNIIVCFRNLFWINIIMLFKLYDISIWRGNMMEFNTNSSTLFTYVHNALEKESVVERAPLMKKIVYLNEKMKSCKIILDDGIYLVINKLFEKIEKNLSKSENILNQLDELDFILEGLVENVNNSNANLWITAREIREIGSELIPYQESIMNMEDSELSLDDRKLKNLNLDFLRDARIDNILGQLICNYRINYDLRYILVLEFIIKKLNNYLYSVNSYDKSDPLFFIFLKSIAVYYGSIITLNDGINELGDDYKQFLIPEDEIEKLHILNDILQFFTQNKEEFKCYCNDKVDIKQNKIDFKLIFSGIKIIFNLKGLINKNNKKSCTSFHKESCKNKKEQNISVDHIKKTSDLRKSTHYKSATRLIKNNINTFAANNLTRSFHTSTKNNLTRSFHTSTKNNLTRSFHTSTKNNLDKTTEYSKSLFNILETIKTMTNSTDIINTKNIQSEIENNWTIIGKEKYKDNVFATIQDLQPKIYDVFIFKNMQAIKRVFPSIYIFFHDIRIYIITYNVIATYFRRTRRTSICITIAEQVAFHIYKNYFIPFLNDKNIKSNPVQFQEEYLISKKLTSRKNKKENDNSEKYEFLVQQMQYVAKQKDALTFYKSINVLFTDVITNIRKRNGNKEDITFRDFMEEIFYYSYNKNSIFRLKKVDIDLEITTYKVKLGEWLITSFEDQEIIKSSWRNGSKSIDLIGLETSPPGTESKIINSHIEFNSNLIQENIDKIANILPTNLPMLHEPNKWSDTEFGGYFNNSLEKNSIITGLGINNEHIIKNKDKLYKAINYTSSLKFNVNLEVLDYINENKDILFKNYYTNDGLTTDEIADNVLRDQVTLKVAEAYKTNTFYLNTFADWRGRIYTNSYYLTYQASDLSLSLLNFEFGEPINEMGAYFFKVYGANLYDENNISRSSYADRINWVDNNEYNILSMNHEFIMKADQRFTFIAFCLAYRNYVNNKKVYLPILLDATCSGIQNIAALLKDKELSEKVNLITNGNDKVVDIYTEMIEPIHKLIKSEVEKDKSLANLSLIKLTRKIIKPVIMTTTYHVTVRGVANQLASSAEKITLENYLKLDELKKANNVDLTKNKLLNLTNNSIIDHLLEKNLDEDINKILSLSDDNDTSLPNEIENNLITEDNLNKLLFKFQTDLEDKPVYLTFKELFKLAQILHNSLFINYPLLRELFDYFISVSSTFSYLDLPITWTAPSGLEITQHYLKKASVKVNLSVGRGKKRTIVLSQKIDEIDSRAQSLAIIPNFVHSLDSSIIILLLSDLMENNNINQPVITIHDCFGTLPNNMFNLFNKVKDVFINMYDTQNILKNFHDHSIKILDDYNVKYTIEKDKIKINLRESFDSTLPLIEELNKKQITAYRKNKLSKLFIKFPPKPGSLNIKDISKSNYFLT